jgi:hypothetical protein
MPCLDFTWMTAPPENHHFCAQALRAPDTEEVVPQVEMRVNPHEGLTKSHKGRNVQDP